MKYPIPKNETDFDRLFIYFVSKNYKSPFPSKYDNLRLSLWNDLEVLEKAKCTNCGKSKILKTYKNKLERMLKND